jgi:carbon monoxide dehydrogenase subunit G
MNLHYSGEETITAGAEAVWSFVTDPGKVGHCFPDVIEVTVHDATHLEAIVRVGVGPVRGKFKLKVELMPDSVRRRIGMKVSGGGFGSAIDLTAGADVVAAGAGTTLLKWDGEAIARGPVATVGGRVLEAQAKKLIEQAFANVRQALSTPVPG